MQVPYRISNARLPLVIQVTLQGSKGELEVGNRTLTPLNQGALLRNHVCTLPEFPLIVNEPGQ
jgi:hypothetical protein